MQTHFHSPRHETCSEKLIHSTSRTQLNTLKTEDWEHTLISSSTFQPMPAPSTYKFWSDLCQSETRAWAGLQFAYLKQDGKVCHVWLSSPEPVERSSWLLAGSRSGHSRPMLTMFLNTLTRIYGWHHDYGSSQGKEEIPLLSLPCKIMLLMEN